MSRIFCIVGKSASGKDTIYKEILKNCDKLIPIIPYTTRPMRSGETDGVDYNFVTEDQMNGFDAAGCIIEKRQYLTTQGIWNYFTVKFDVKPQTDYILITTLEGAMGITDHYGADMVRIVYLTIDDKTRLLRYIERESKQARPDYEEVCRRFIADQKDFSQENINALKNVYSINSALSVEECLAEWDKIYHAAEV